jgi:hypothetical protein
MPKNTCDGEVYIHNLSTFIKAHEPQLANALVAYKKLSLKSSSTTTTTTTASASTSLSTSTSTSAILSSSNDQTNEEDDKLTLELSKPVRLSLSLHHLYFILGRFKELGNNIGPMNLRLDNIDSDSASNYVSFLSEFQRHKKLDSDAQSIHSISSVKSVMSSVSALWNNFGSTSKIDNGISDLKYLYSAFSKLPCLRLANEPNSKLIEGHEEYPFETATPIIVFKNILVLEISDLDPKEIYGWNFLANKLRYLVIKNSNIIDPIEILVNLVDADANVRGEEDVFADTDHQNDDNDYDDNKLIKSNSNNSDSNEKNYDKISFRNSLSTSNVSLSQSSLNLTTSLSSPKHNLSPNLHQSQSFSTNQYAFNPLHHSSHNNYSYTHTHNYNHNYNPNYVHHHYNYHYPVSSDNLQSISTSPNSISPNYYPNRLYAEDFIAANAQQSNLSSSVHSTRRSYYYKPQKKSRRSRNSSSLIISPTINNINLSNNNNTKCTVESNEPLENYSKSEQIVNNGGTINDCNNRKSFELVKNQNSYWKLLKHLSMTENKIEKISLHAFDRLSNLSLLDLSYNKLTSIPSEPLSKLLNLKTLNLSFNKLLNVDKFPNTLKKLIILNLRGNKIKNLDSIENLSNLQKLDLRQNNLNKVVDLKPILLLNKDKVLLTSIHLLGNPVSKSRGYRVELFNLFNGVDYNNAIRIDGSRPGIFESRMLLDEKLSRMRFKNYIDESIISKMTASVSNMNLNSIVNNQSLHSSNLMNSKNQFVKNSIPKSLNLEGRTEIIEINHPVLDQMSTSINVNNTANNNSETSSIKKVSASPTVKSSLNTIINRSNSINSISQEIISTTKRIPADNNNNSNNTNATNENSTNTNINTNADVSAVNDANPEHLFISNNGLLSSSPSMASIRNQVSVNYFSSSTVSSEQTPLQTSNAISNSIVLRDFPSPLNRSVPHSQRTSNDYSNTTSILTNNTLSANGDANPIARLSLASPALPVITQATTTTMTITNMPTSFETGSSTVDLTPKSVSSRKEYFSNTSKINDEDDNKENKKNITIANEDVKLSGEEYSTGLKISVV